MIPSLLLIRFGRDLKYWLPMPVFLLWPLLLLTWIVVKVLRLFVPTWKDPCTLILFALRAFAAARGFAFAIQSDDTNFSLRIW